MNKKLHWAEWLEVSVEPNVRIYSPRLVQCTLNSKQALLDRGQDFSWFTHKVNTSYEPRGAKYVFEHAQNAQI